MSDQTLKSRLRDEMKAAMQAKDKQRLSTIRLIQAEIKRIEVDECRKWSYVGDLCLA